MSGFGDANDDSGVECVRVELTETHTHRRRQSLRDRRSAVEVVRSTSFSTAGLGCSVNAMEARRSAACVMLVPMFR